MSRIPGSTTTNENIQLAICQHTTPSLSAYQSITAEYGMDVIRSLFKQSCQSELQVISRMAFLKSWPEYDLCESMKAMWGQDEVYLVIQ